MGINVPDEVPHCAVVGRVNLLAILRYPHGQIELEPDPVLGAILADPLATGPALLALVDAQDPPLRVFFGVGLLDTAANGFFAFATTHGLLSLVAIVGSLYPVVTVVLAYTLLHERIARHQRMGVVAALAGVALISGG